MKTVISVFDLAEMEIKPESEVSHWRALLDSDVATLWADRSSWVEVTCPCCSGSMTGRAFSHGTVAYDECLECGTVFAPSRPNADQLTKWYRESKSATFWRDSILQASGEARMQKVVLPRTQWILDGIAEYAPDAERLVDISTNGRAMLEEIDRQRGRLAEIISAGPISDLEGESRGNVIVKAESLGSAENIGAVDVVTAVDSFDRASDLTGLVGTIHRALRHGGLLFATVPVSSGFEIQALWEKTPSIVPPDKLNIPSVSGLQRMFSSPRWELLELSTTGMLDVEIVYRVVSENPDAPWPRVLKSIALNDDVNSRRALIEYLQSQRLTSFARLVARRID